ncbi:MAG: N-succinylarginine dihydrolase [Caulobacteraceae bacterium]|nr:N-succinylarginine dihydrolase [Caulobacteraceae bacterium]
MSLREVNFDGLVGPTHNYCGLSPGNLASATNADAVSCPRAAALQGLEKMRAVMGLGAPQGFLPPPLRPAAGALRAYGFDGSDDVVLAAAAGEDPALLRAACSASSMWTANAATVIAAPDAADGRTHLVCANLASMLHRALEAADTFATLRRVFADEALFAVHAPLPHGVHFGDEGAANHMRLAQSHGAPGVNVFVHGARRDGRFPERQSLRASQAVARLAGVDRPVFALQAAQAVEAGAFHNDVVAVANERVLVAHEGAFDDPDALVDALTARVTGFQYLEVGGFDLAAAVSSYLFNSQIITRPDGGMTLVAPAEARADARVWAEVERLLAADNPIDQALVVDLRESMRNGGGPACLRLRVPLSPAALARVDARFLLGEARIDALARLVERAWPEAIAPADLADAALWAQARAAHAELERLIAGWS